MIELEEPIGEGSYGTVFRGTIRTWRGVRKGPYAFKVMKVFEDSDSANGTIVKRFWREAEYLKKCNHPNIITMLGVSKLPDGRECLVLQLMEEKLLDFVRDRQANLLGVDLRRVMRELLDAVAYLHRHGFSHRDIKPQNLMTKKGRAKIIDFGFVRDLGSVQEITRQVANLQYRAPELILGAKYSNKVDIWSLGCVFYQLVEGRLPFDGSSQLELLLSMCARARAIPYRFTNLAYNKFKIGFGNLRKTELQFKEGAPQDLRHLITRMLELEPQERISAEEACRLPYFEIKSAHKPQSKSVAHLKQSSIRQGQARQVRGPSLPRQPQRPKQIRLLRKRIS